MLDIKKHSPKMPGKWSKQIGELLGEAFALISVAIIPVPTCSTIVATTHTSLLGCRLVRRPSGPIRVSVGTVHSVSD